METEDSIENDDKSVFQNWRSTSTKSYPVPKKVAIYENREISKCALTIRLNNGIDFLCKQAAETDTMKFSLARKLGWNTRDIKIAPISKFKMATGNDIERSGT